MNLEKISKEECLIREILNEWSKKISEEYIKKNEIAMDAKMYFSLNVLYLKKKNRFYS